MTFPTMFRMKINGTGGRICV